MDRQTVLLKSGINIAEQDQILFLSVFSKPHWPNALGHLVLNNTCLHTGSRPLMTDSFTFISTENSDDAWQVLQAFFPTFSFLDLALFAHQMSEHKSEKMLFGLWPLIDFFLRLHHTPDLDLMRLLKTLHRLPESAQKHLHEKKWQWGDLQIFLSLPELKREDLVLFDKLFSFPLSKSDMVSCCELLVELILMNAEIEMSSWNAQNIKKSLMTLRFPQKVATIGTAPIKNIHIKQVRQNDRQGFEFKFFSANEQELQKTLSKLQQSEIEWI